MARWASMWARLSRKRSADGITKKSTRSTRRGRGAPPPRHGAGARSWDEVRHALAGAGQHDAVLRWPGDGDGVTVGEGGQAARHLLDHAKSDPVGQTHLVFAVRPEVHGVGDRSRERVGSAAGGRPRERCALRAEHHGYGRTRLETLLGESRHAVRPDLHGDLGASSLGHRAEEEVGMAEELSDEGCAWLPVELDGR